jgi:hypothetical protein
MPIAQIQENDRKERFVATAGQTVFPYDFPIYAATDLQVRRERSGVITTLTYGADYSVTGAQNQTGGNVVLTAGATLNDIIVILSNMPSARTGQFVNGGDLSAAALEAEFNRNRILIQQNYRDGRNALLFPPTDPTMQDLPPIALRANRFLAFDTNGQPYAATPAAGTVLDAISRLGDNMAGRFGFTPGSAAAPGLTPNNDNNTGFFSATNLIGVSVNGQEAARFIPGGMEFLQLEAGAQSRTIQDKLRDILHPRDFGIVPTNADNATGFANLAAAVQARGGGTILFPANQTYDVFTASFTAPVSVLMAFSGLKGVRIFMNGSRIRTTRNWISAAATCRLFQFTDCEDIDLEFSALQATGTTTDMFTTGHIGAYFMNGCKRVRVRARCEGGRSGVEVVRAAGFSFANYAEGFDIDLETQNVFYPIAFERNGRNAEINLIAKSAGRSLFLANASNIRADVWTDNTVGYDDIVLSASCAPSEGIINNACDNIDLKITHRPPFAGTSALSALVTLVYQQMDSVNETVPGRLSNVSVKFDCDYQGNENLVPAKFFYAATQKFGSANATALTAHFMDTIKVSGGVFAAAGTAILVDFLRDGNAALGASAVIGNISFEDWIVTNGTGAQSFEIQASVVDFGLTLKNINNPNGAVNFAGALPIGILDASQSVVASNFRSSGSNVNGRYQRLPEGRMRQWGTAGSVAAVANTTVTLPLSFRDGAGLPQLQSATGGTTDAINIGSVTASNFAINRPGGSSAISVAWEVEGDA